MARKSRNKASDVIERKRQLEQEIDALRAALPELQEAARKAEEDYREIKELVSFGNRAQNPEFSRRHGALTKAKDDLRAATDRLNSLEGQLREIVLPATLLNRRQMVRQRLEDAEAKRNNARAAIDRIEARLQEIEAEIVKTDQRMQKAAREARLAAIEGRDQDTDAIIAARADLERLTVEKKTHEEALDEARRMYDRASAAAVVAASDLREVEGSLALIELRDLLRDNRDIVQRIVASPGVNEDRITQAFNDVAREVRDDAQATG